MGKQTVGQPYNGLLLGNEEEYMQEHGSQTYYTKWKKPDSKAYTQCMS